MTIFGLLCLSLSIILSENVTFLVEGSVQIPSDFESTKSIDFYHNNISTHQDDKKTLNGSKAEFLYLMKESLLCTNIMESAVGVGFRLSRDIFYDETDYD